MDKNGTNIIYFNRARTWIYDHTIEKPNGKGIHNWDRMGNEVLPKRHYIR